MSSTCVFWHNYRKVLAYNLKQKDMKTTPLFIAALLSTGMLLLSQEATSQNTKSMKVGYVPNTSWEIKNDNSLKKSVKSVLKEWTKNGNLNSGSAVGLGNSVIMEELENQVKFRPVENIEDIFIYAKEEPLDSLVNILAEEVKYRPGQYFE